MDMMARRRALMAAGTGGGGGGLVPPVNAVAQFEVSASIETNPTKIVMDTTGLWSKMQANRSYVHSLILWRNDVVDSTSYTQIAEVLLLYGRMAKNAMGGLAEVYYSLASSMTSSVQGNSSNIYNSGSLSNGIWTVTLKNLSSTDCTGTFKGIFTLLSPWTSEYTGQKLTTCPSGFLAFK